MALERIGLGGVLTFNSDQAVKATGKARDEFGRFLTTAQKVPPAMKIIGVSTSQAMSRMAAGTRKIGAGIKQMGAGLAQASLGFAPLTAAVGAGIFTAAQFEQTMAGVSAITRATGDDMAKLTSKAKEMGIKSVFSATEAGQAMEFMGRAGATTDQIIGGLTGVMNAAASEGIDLATASDIIAQTTKIMGRRWEDAANTADILALTSAKTNTNMSALNEALKIGGQVAANMGFELEETAATMGLLANAGLRGGAGGTALNNMFMKLQRPSKKGAALIEKWGIKLTTSTGAMRTMAEIVADFGVKIDGISNKQTQAAITTELFGQRGKRAFQALSSAGKEEMDSLTAVLKKASEGQGAAAEASAKRLNTLLGAWKLFKSSIESTSIGIFGPMLKSFQLTIEGITLGLNKVLDSLTIIQDTWGDVSDESAEALAKARKHAGGFFDVALGIQDAIVTIKDAFNTVVVVTQAIGNVLSDTFGGSNIRTITKWVIIISGILAVAAPLVLMMVTFGFAISGIMSALTGLAAIASGVFGIITSAISFVIALISGPVLIAVGLLVGVFLLLRREGESVGETMTRVWGNIQAGAIQLWENVLKPFVAGFMEQWAVMGAFISEVWTETFGEVVSVLKFVIEEVKATFGEMFGAWGDGTNEMSFNWIEFGSMAATFIGLVIGGIIKTIGFLVKAALFIGLGLFKILAWPFIQFQKVVQGILNVILSFMEDGFVGGILNLVKVLLNVISAPFRRIMELAAQAIDLIPGVDLPPELKNFKGFTTKNIFTEETPKGTTIADVAVEGTKAQPPQIQATAEKGFLEKIQDEITGITDLKATEKAKAAETPKLEATIKLEDKRCIEVTSNLSIDGHETIIAEGRVRQELQERAGFKATPWQRRVSLEQGVAPIRKAV